MCGCACFHALIHERHGEERDGDLFSGGNHHVELTGIRTRLDLFRKRYQTVGLTRHGRNDDDQLMAAIRPLRDAARDVLDALGAADGGAAILLDDQGHDCKEETGGEKTRILIEIRGKDEPSTGRLENCHTVLDPCMPSAFEADGPLAFPVPRA